MILRLMAAAGFALVASSLQAEQLAEDVAVLEECVAAKWARGEANECIGVVNDPCQAKGEYSTYEVTRCLIREREAWMAILDSALEILLARAARIDEEVGEPEVYGRRTNALKEAQSVWLEYRAAQCHYEAHPTMRGTLQGVIGGICLMELTAERAIRLNDMVRRGN